MTGSAERSPIQDPEHRAAVWNIAVQLYESARPPGSLLALVKEIEDALHYLDPWPPSPRDGSSAQSDAPPRRSP